MGMLLAFKMGGNAKCHPEVKKSQDVLFCNPSPGCSPHWLPICPPRHDKRLEPDRKTVLALRSQPAWENKVPRELVQRRGMCSSRLSSEVWRAGNEMGKLRLEY